MPDDFPTVSVSKAIPRYTYLGQWQCVAETRDQAYSDLVLSLSADWVWKIEEKVCAGVITFTAAAIEAVR